MLQEMPMPHEEVVKKSLFWGDQPPQSFSPAALQGSRDRSALSQVCSLPEAKVLIPGHTVVRGAFLLPSSNFSAHKTRQR